MALTVYNRVQRVLDILQDRDMDRWSLSQLVGFLNDGYISIVELRPDANSLSGEFTCAAGTRQVLSSSFPTAVSLIDIVRNISTGRPIRIIDRQMLDDYRRNWHAETQKTEIQHYVYDPRIPREFLVYPPSKAGVKIEAVYSLPPTFHDETKDYSTTDEAINLNDLYGNALVQYMAFRAYSTDADHAANAGRAAAHFQLMQQELGIKTQSDGAVTPKQRQREPLIS